MSYDTTSTETEPTIVRPETEPTIVPSETEPVAVPSTPSAPFSDSRFDIGSFLMGALFVVIGVAFMFEATDQWTFELSDFRYFAPLALILFGAAIAMGGVTRHRRST